MTSQTPPETKDQADELLNFLEMARHLRPAPGDIPRLGGIDIAGLSLPLKQVVGGDHIIYLDFRHRYDLEQRIDRARAGGRVKVVKRLEELRRCAGILLADVSGHRMTDALIGAMLHQAFLLGAYYELDRYGRITTRIFEHINSRFYRTTAINKYFSMIYGEISVGGRFRFISAGHPAPAVFSREFGRFVKISEDRLVSFPPVGLFPSASDPDQQLAPSKHGYKKRYSVNEINLLSRGDTLLLVTDGLTDHDEGRFFPATVEHILAHAGTATSAEICDELRGAILARATPTDDISCIVIRRTA